MTKAKFDNALKSETVGKSDNEDENDQSKQSLSSLIVDFDNGLLTQNESLKNELIDSLSIDNVNEMRFNQLAEYFDGQKRVDAI